MVILLPFIQFHEVVVNKFQKIVPGFARADDIEKLFFGIDIVNFFVDKPFHQFFHFIESELGNLYENFGIFRNLLVGGVDIVHILIEIDKNQKTLDFIEKKIPLVIRFGKSFEKPMIAQNEGIFSRKVLFWCHCTATISSFHLK